MLCILLWLTEKCAYLVSVDKLGLEQQQFNRILDLEGTSNNILV